VSSWLALSTLEVVNTALSAASLLVVAGTAFAAIVQLRHLRASNELEALLTIASDLRRTDLRRAFRYVQTELEGRLEDPAYRAELACVGFVDAERHPEMDACNWLNQLGTLVKNRLIDEATFLDLFARLVTYYWERLEQVIALLRRERGAGQYENFEYLAVLARAWKAKHPDGTFPPSLPRLQVVDRWREPDELP